MVELRELPLHVQEDVRKAINTNPQVIALKQKQVELYKRGKFVEALDIAKTIEKITQNVVDGICTQRTSLGEIFKEMSQEDIERANVACNTIIMLSDIIETQSMELNQVLHKYRPDMDVDMYDRFAMLGKEAKEQMAFMSKFTNNLYQVKFGDVADNLCEMITNKVRKLLRMVAK